MTTLVMTTGIRKALRILRDHDSLRPSQFAEHYFPKDHPGWLRYGKCGQHGVHRGQGLVLWAGGFLGQLRRRGFAVRIFDDRDPLANETAITDEGREALRLAGG